MESAQPSPTSPCSWRSRPRGQREREVVSVRRLHFSRTGFRFSIELAITIAGRARHLCGIVCTKIHEISSVPGPGFPSCTVHHREEAQYYTKWENVGRNAHFPAFNSVLHIWGPGLWHDQEESPHEDRNADEDYNHRRRHRSIRWGRRGGDRFDASF